MKKIAGGPRQLSAYIPSFDYLIINVCITQYCSTVYIGIAMGGPAL